MVIRRWALALIALLAGVFVGVSARPASAGFVSTSCNVFPIAADGTIGTTPLATGVRSNTVASALAPSQVRQGERFQVTVPTEALTLLTSAEGFEVVSLSDFIRVFEITGGTVVSGSVEQTPATGTTAETTAGAVRLGLSIELAAGTTLRYPEASFDVVAGTAGRDVTVSLLAAESNVTLRLPDQSLLRVRAVCPADANILSRTAVLAPVPASRAECKNGGWRNLVDAEGRSFRNQGLCVRFVVSNRPS